MIRGDIWTVDFGYPYGSEPAFIRPALIIQSNSFNESSMNTTIVVPLTSNLRLADFPGNKLLTKESTNLSKDSVVVTPQLTVIDRSRLLNKISSLSAEIMAEYADDLRLVLGL